MLSSFQVDQIPAFPQELLAVGHHGSVPASFRGRDLEICNLILTDLATHYNAVRGLLQLGVDQPALNRGHLDRSVRLFLETGRTLLDKINCLIKVG